MPLEKESLNNFLPDGFETNNLEGAKENFSADKIATGYEKDVKDRVSGPNFNNLLDVIGKNTNVLTKFMDFIKNMPVNNLFAVDENNQLVYKNLDEVGGGGLEIGDIGIAPLGIDETKGKRRYLNGQVIIQEQYVQFTNKVKSAVALYPSLACTESEWQTTATMTVGGQVGKFVVDDDAGTIRLPKIIMPIQGLTDLSKLGEIVEAGLPNITGSIRAYVDLGAEGQDGANEALYTERTGTYYTGTQTAGGATDRNRLSLDASRSNSIYGNSSTVQQEQIQYPYFIQVATGSETEDNIINEIELNNPFSLLDYKFSEYELNNLSWLRSNGQYNSKAVYPAVYDLLLKIYNGTETKAGVSVKLSTEEYTDYDFVLNTAEETFRLPLKVKLASGKAVVGNGLPLGLQFTGYGGTYTLPGRLGYGSQSIVYGTQDGTGFTDLKVTTDPTKSGLELSDSDLYLYFYVGETVQNANLINAGRIEEKLAGKVDSANTQWAINALIPDYSAGIDISSQVLSGYTAPSDGFITYAYATPKINTITVNNNIVTQKGSTSGTYTLPAQIFVKKGDVFKATLGDWYSYFFPLKGAK